MRGVCVGFVAPALVPAASRLIGTRFGARPAASRGVGTRQTGSLRHKDDQGPGQSRDLGDSVAETLPSGAISTSSPRFRAFQSLPVVSGDRSTVPLVASTKY